MSRERTLTVQRTVYMTPEMWNYLTQPVHKRGHDCNENVLIREAVRYFIDNQQRHISEDPKQASNAPHPQCACVADAHLHIGDSGVRFGENSCDCYFAGWHECKRNANTCSNSYVAVNEPRAILRALIVDDGSYSRFWYQAPNQTRSEQYGTPVAVGMSEDSEWQHEALKSISVGQIPVDSTEVPQIVSSIVVTNESGIWYFDARYIYSPLASLYIPFHPAKYLDPERLIIRLTSDPLPVILKLLSSSEIKAKFLKEDTTTLGRKMWLIEGE